MSTDKSSTGVRIVSAVALEMRNAIIALGGERGWFENRSRWLERAARRAGITYRAAKALFYCETTDPKSSVVDRVRRAAAPYLMSQEQQEAVAREEYQGLVSRIVELTARLDQMDPDFHRATIDALRGQVRQGSASDGPLDRE